MSTASKVKQRVKRIRRGVPFSPGGWTDLGTTNAVQKALYRLVRVGEIDRVWNGVYARPKYLSVKPGAKVSVSAEKQARYWARINGYILVHQGPEAAYRLGIQTQAPMTAVFWTNGPSRIFKQGYQVVEVRHVRNVYLKWPDHPVGEIFRGLLATPLNSVKSADIIRMFDRLLIPKHEIGIVIQRLQSEPLMSKWMSKLRKVEKSS